MGCATSIAVAELTARIDMLQTTVNLQNSALKRAVEGLPTTADILRIETLVTKVEEVEEEEEEEPPTEEPETDSEDEEEQTSLYGFTWAWR
jgi:hypothetical protein